MTKAKTTTKAKATKTASTSNKIKTIASKKRTLTVGEELKALRAENKVLRAEKERLTQEQESSRIADLTSRARRSKMVFFREPKDSDVFFGYVRTKNTNGSEYLHKFSREKITSKFGSVYHQGYKFLISKEEVDARTEAAKQLIADLDSREEAPVTPKTEAEVTTNNSVC